MFPDDPMDRLRQHPLPSLLRVRCLLHRVLLLLLHHLSPVMIGESGFSRFKGFVLRGGRCRELWSKVSLLRPIKRPITADACDCADTLQQRFNTLTRVDAGNLGTIMLENSVLQCAF